MLLGRGAVSALGCGSRRRCNRIKIRLQNTGVGPSGSAVVGSLYGTSTLAIPSQAGYPADPSFDYLSVLLALNFWS